MLVAFAVLEERLSAVMV
jgi:hypothetical protein